MKLTVAILDKDAAFRGVMTDKVMCLAQKYEFDVSISTFQNPIELEKNKLPFDLLLMDVFFDGTETDGIAWAKKQIPSGRYVNLVYVSAHEHEVFHAIETSPIAFVRKSKLDDDLDNAFRVYKDKLASLPTFVVIPEGRKRHIYLPDDIVYLCSNGHYIDIFHRNGERKVIRGKLGDIEKVLCYHGFLRVHVSYLINMRHIVNVDKKTIYLSNKRYCHASEKYRDSVYEKLHLYHFDGLHENPPQPKHRIIRHKPNS